MKLNDAPCIMVGEKTVKAVYLGKELIWQANPPEPEPEPEMPSEQEL